jgi:hypothetical protein
VLDLPSGTTVVVNDAAPVALEVPAEGLTMTVTDVDAAGRGRRVTYGPLTGDLVVAPGAGDVPAVSVDGEPVSPAHDTGGGGGGAQTPPRGGEVVIPPAGDDVVTPQPSPALVASVRGGRMRLTKAGVAAIPVQLRGGSSTGVVALTAKLGRRTVRIGSARVALPAGRTVKAKVKVSKAARRAVTRGGLRAVATLSVRGAAAAKAAVRLKR